MFILSMSLISKACAPDSIFGRDNAHFHVPVRIQSLGSMRNLTRRELLKLGAASAVAELTSLGLHGCGSAASGGPVGSPPSTPTPSVCSTLTDIDHVVILIQENRSFDHCFGSYRGVRGFSDQSMAFQQPDPANTTNSPLGKLLPFHLDTSTTNAACTHDISHDWVPQHQSWDNGAMDGFVSSRLPINANDAVLSMGYYNRADLPYYYALADAFTICDNFFCSVMGPTDPNRLYTMAASLTPMAPMADPFCRPWSQIARRFYGRLTYTTMPEQLQARGISWKVYSSPDEAVAGGILSDNVLPYFKNFQDPTQCCIRMRSDRSSPWTSWLMWPREICRKSPGCGLGPDVGSPAFTLSLRREHCFADRRCSDRESRAVGQDAFSCSPMMKMADSSITFRR